MNLKQSGYRLTNSRIKIIQFFLATKRPVSVDELFDALKEQGVHINKTTVYREVDFLIDKKILAEVRLDERKRRYEMAHLDHHHHLVCMNCKAIDDFHMPAIAEKFEKRQEAGIYKEKRFKVLNHSLEFFGLCAHCQ